MSESPAIQQRVANVRLTPVAERYEYGAPHGSPIGQAQVKSVPRTVSGR